MLRLRFSQGLRHGPHVFAWLFLLLVIAALVVGIVALIRIRRLAAARSQSGSWSAEGSRIDPALAELRVRYALRRGELGGVHPEGNKSGISGQSRLGGVHRLEPATAGAVAAAAVHPKTLMGGASFAAALQRLGTVSESTTKWPDGPPAPRHLCRVRQRRRKVTTIR